MQTLFFSKYHSSGNDFILIDNRKKTFPINDKKLIQKICHRNLGVGADGLIMLQRSDSADIKMRIFNKDGSEAQCCGNGLSCLLSFMLELGYAKKKYSIETLHSVVSGSYLDDKMVVSLKGPKILEKKLHLQLFEDKSYEVTYINSGVPHIVYFCDDINNIDVKKVGKKLCHHTYFHPYGVNVNFAKKENDHINVRTYERGVEEETSSCGTGAIAVAIATHLIYNLQSPLLIKFKHGSINVMFEVDKNKINEVTLISLANFVYLGRYVLE